MANQFQVSEETVSLQAERIVYRLTFPMVFKAALELGVIDTIAALDEGVWLSPSEIAFRLPTRPTNPEAPMLLDRMMRLLTSHSILKCRVVETGENDQTRKTERVYAAEPVCKFFLKDSDGSGSLLSLFKLCQNHVVFKALSHLKDVILEGKDTFVSAYGKQVFEYLDSDEQFASMFGHCLVSHSHSFLEFLTAAKSCHNLPPSGLASGELYPRICWRLWLSRNEFIFSNKVSSEKDTITKAQLAQQASPPPPRSPPSRTHAPLSSELGHRDIRIYSDSLPLVNSLNTGQWCNTIHGTLDDVMDLKTLFSSISFQFISRNLNCTADQLAKRALYALDSCNRAKLLIQSPVQIT